MLVEDTNTSATNALELRVSCRCQQCSRHDHRPNAETSVLETHGQLEESANLAAGYVDEIWRWRYRSVLMVRPDHEHVGEYPVGQGL